MMDLYSVHDVVSGVFSDPIVEFNEGTAIRGFTEFVRSYPYRNDVELVCLGHWDNSTGKIQQMPNDYVIIIRGSAIAVESEVDYGSSEV